MLFIAAYQISNRPVHLSFMFRELAPEFRCIEGEDVAETLTRFVRKYNINVLAMIPHRYSLLERWFIVSATREMAFTTTIPLLLLPEKQEDQLN